MRYGHEFTAYVMAALGLKRGDHLPLDGIAPRVVETEGEFRGHRHFTVWVTPVPHAAQRGRVFKSAKHRLMAQCPDCGKAVSVGRLNQHVCGSMHAATLPYAFPFTAYASALLRSWLSEKTDDAAGDE